MHLFQIVNSSPVHRANRYKVERWIISLKNLIEPGWSVLNHTVLRGRHGRPYTCNQQACRCSSFVTGEMCVLGSLALAFVFRASVAPPAQTNAQTRIAKIFVGDVMLISPATPGVADIESCKCR